MLNLLLNKKTFVILIVFCIFSCLNCVQCSAQVNNGTVQKNISKSVKQEPDFAPYMNEIQSAIKKNWTPPKGNESKRAVVLFSVARDGRLLNVKIKNSSGIKEVDDAAIKAVKLTSPFKPLPSGFKGDKVDIQFTFDYTIRNIFTSNKVNVSNKLNGNLTPIEQALWNSDTEKFKNIIQKGNFNVINNTIYNTTGRYILECALLVPKPKAEIIDLIIKAGADVNKVSKDGFSPLHTITIRQDLDDPYDIVNLLIKAGANVNAVEKKGLPVIVMAVMNGHVKTFKLLIQNGADLNIQIYGKGSLLDLAEFQKNKTQNAKYDEIIRILKKSYNISQLNNENENIVLPSASTPTKTDILPFSTYGFKYIYQLNVKTPVKNLEFTVPLPYNINELQYISDLKITPKPDVIEKGRFYRTNNSNYISAKYIIPNLDKEFKIVFEGKVKTRTYNLKAAKKINQNISPETQITLQKYLQPEKYIESNDPYIKSIAEKIQGNTQEEIVENIYKYTQDKIKYKKGLGVGAKEALMRGYGKCLDYAEIMTAIARAKGIPARVAPGKILNSEGSELHAWVEIYYDKYGWVTYDPTIEPVTKNFYDIKGNVTRSETIYSVSRNKKYLKTEGYLFAPYVMRPFDKNVNVDIRAYGYSL